MRVIRLQYSSYCNDYNIVKLYDYNIVHILTMVR